MPDLETRSAQEKARKINLDGQRLGTFAEIGAGQEVACCFFHVGKASATVAKSISAYDMATSDAVYGPTQFPPAWSRPRMARRTIPDASGRGAVGDHRPHRDARSPHGQPTGSRRAGGSEPALRGSLSPGRSRFPDRRAARWLGTAAPRSGHDQVLGPGISRPGQSSTICWRFRKPIPRF